MTADEALIALNMLPCIGPVRIRRLLASFGSAETILGSPTSKLLRVEGIGQESADIIRNWENHADPGKEIAEAKMADLNANDIDGATLMVMGTARSMGLEVVG